MSVTDTDRAACLADRLIAQALDAGRDHVTDIAVDVWAELRARGFAARDCRKSDIAARVSAALDSQRDDRLEGMLSKLCVPDLVRIASTRPRLRNLIAQAARATQGD